MVHSNLLCHDIQAVYNKFPTNGPTDLFMLGGEECSMFILAAPMKAYMAETSAIN